MYADPPSRYAGRYKRGGDGEDGMVSMRGLGVVAAAAVLLLAVGCGTAGETSSTVPSETPMPSSQPLDAEAVVNQIKATGVPIGKVIVYTAETDPNDLLGRPNGYLSKTAFVDTRIAKSKVQYADDDAIERGGSVEVYEDEASAQARMDYIQETIKSVPMLGAEYDYVVGPVLVRVSGVLTPTQARTYRDALEQ